jgi:hypothetical protein
MASICIGSVVMVCVAIPWVGERAAASVCAAVVAEISLGDVCPCHEILRSPRRGSAIALLPLGVVFVRVRQFYIASGRELKRLEGIGRYDALMMRRARYLRATAPQ